MGKLLAVAGIGWVAGAKIHTKRLSRKLKTKHYAEMKSLYNDAYELKENNAKLTSMVKQLQAALHPGVQQGMGHEGRPNLRFTPGTKVEARLETGWARGTVTRQWHRESEWPPNSYVPYQIQLEDGTLIFAPEDSDQIVRKR